MALKITKEAYTNLIQEDLDFLDRNCKSDSIELDHIKLVLCTSIDMFYPHEIKDRKVNLSETIDNNDFKLAIWSIVQELVWAHREPEIAKEIIRNHNLTIQDCEQLQKQSNSLKDVMIPFIKDLEK